MTVENWCSHYTKQFILYLNPLQAYIVRNHTLNTDPSILSGESVSFGKKIAVIREKGQVKITSDLKLRSF